MTLAETINQLAEDKSHDWTDEIAALEAVEKELSAARDELESYRANVGSIKTIITTSRNAHLGQNLTVGEGSALVRAYDKVRADQHALPHRDQTHAINEAYDDAIYSFAHDIANIIRKATP